ncbi:hypothetical protein [Allocoleopsis sp.]|uniref:hypothetical protein n=1 Tax=Allocoleopsis sp. TaxID=3088169 RepID=UPI002FD2A175
MEANLMSAIASYSVSNLSALRQRASLPNNANMIVARPYNLFAVPPTNHVWVSSSLAEFSVNVMTGTDTSRRWIAMGGTPAVGYQPPSGGAFLIGMIAIDAVSQSVYLSVNNAGTSSDWINITGNGAGTGL